MTEIEAEGPKLTSRDHAKIRTAERVLAAARALFEEDGFAKATIRNIAKKAKMSTGAIFANYDDKVELYKAVYEHAPVTPEQGRELLQLAEKSWKELFYAQEDQYDRDRQELMADLMAAIRSVKPDYAAVVASERDAAIIDLMEG